MRDPVWCPNCQKRSGHEGECVPMHDNPTNTAGEQILCHPSIHADIVARAERRIVEWHRKRAEHYVHLNHLADWHNGCADAIERGEHRA